MPQGPMFGAMPDEDYRPATVDDHLPQEIRGMDPDEARGVLNELKTAIREGTDPLKVLARVIGTVRGIIAK